MANMDEQAVSSNITQKSDTALREEQILNFWREHNTFKKSLDLESPKGEFVFYDGPPFATGTPHYGHLLAGTIKDVIPRYKTMQGYHVARKWGWDCHGLPIENLVEKELNLSNKKDIEAYGIENFNEAARASVMRYESEWKNYVPRSGRWVDMDSPYMSIHPSYMESVWWIFSELHRKGLTKQGSKAMHLCPRCETTLANFEVNQGYQDVTDISVTAKFKLQDQENTFLLAWTTTPWTLPGNVALAVGSDISYVKIEHEGNFYILAEERVASVFEGAEYQKVANYSGTELVGMSYTPIFTYYQEQNIENHERGWKVYQADFVTVEDGTGIVHIAPAFGSDDMELGSKLDLPFIQHVGRNGTFIDDFAVTVEGESFQGMKVKTKGDWTSTDIVIIKKMAQDGKLYSKQKLVHSYPHCWRCDTPLLNFATSSWFVDVPAIKDRLVALNTKVHWVPENVGEGRFGTWLEGARDWALSRSRFWGTPLPVWQNETGTELMVMSSVEDLVTKSVQSGNTYLGLRHGQALSNVTEYINADPSKKNPLTEKGREQVVSQLGEIEGKQIDYIFVSPFERTLETAQIIKESLGLRDDQIIIDERLRERSVGESWEGKLWSDAHAFEEANHGNDFLNYRIADDAESIAELYARTMDYMFDLEQRYTNKTILIVAHGDVLKTIQFATDYYGNELRARDFYYTNLGPANGDIYHLNFRPFPHNKKYVLDLHRPYLDKVKVLGESGEKLSLLGDVFDVWFDSGSMPYAQVHYPFEHKDGFEETRFPAQFIAEGLDQTRGWFYVLSVLGTALFDKIPFENVVVNGLILAEDGKKMSKSLKNYPDPYHLFDTVGADALRLYLMASPLVKAEEVAFSEKGVRELASKVLGRTRNVVTLYQSYAGEELHTDAVTEGILDQWIMARIRILNQEITSGLEAYELDRASRLIIDFVDDFSTWYVRRSRDRYKSDDVTDRQAALVTTRKVLVLFAEMVAPVMPFLAEELWQELRKQDASMPESVHLSSWPELEISSDDEQVISYMSQTRALVSEGLQLRAQAGIKVRQPLRSFCAPLENLPLVYHELILDELNVRELKNGEKMLDTELDDELVREGQLRDLVRHIQSLRKEAQMVPADDITIHIVGNDEAKALVNSFAKNLMVTTNATDLVFVESLDQVEELDLGNLAVRVQIK